MQKTWAPRGSLTAQYLYNISEGWVTHDEVRGSFRAPLPCAFSDLWIIFFQMNVSRHPPY